MSNSHIWQNIYKYCLKIDFFIHIYLPFEIILHCTTKIIFSDFLGIQEGFRLLKLCNYNMYDITLIEIFSCGNASSVYSQKNSHDSNHSTYAFSVSS